MKRKQLIVLGVLPLALAASGFFGMRLAAEASRTVGSDSIVRFVRDALDRPDKLTPEHVNSVLGTAAVLEQADLARQRSLITSLDESARGSLQLAGLGVLLLFLAHRLGGRDRGLG